jgi:Rrf2 family transcriptional regulator, cysteine metabolism repressor
LSRPFVANILKELCHKGFVTSHPGVKGGYALHPTASTVTLASLLDAIDERFRLTVCSDHGHGAGEPCAVERGCPVKNPLADIHRRIIGVLDGVTLGDLFGPTARPGPPLLELLPLLPRTAGCCGPAAAPVNA